MRVKIEITISEPDTSDERYPNRERTVTQIRTEGEVNAGDTAAFTGRLINAAHLALQAIQGGQEDGPLKTN